MSISPQDSLDFFGPSFFLLNVPSFLSTACPTLPSPNAGPRQPNFLAYLQISINTVVYY